MTEKKQLKTEDVLDKETLAKLKKELLSRKKQILKDLADISVEGGDGKVKFPEFGDKIDENAQEVGEYSTNLATEKVLESTLRDINNSLDRIKKGTYGICKYCGQPISKKRLLARPVASACVACKTKLQSQS
jgi:DnaK suppressor protein